MKKKPSTDWKNKGSFLKLLKIYIYFFFHHRSIRALMLATNQTHKYSITSKLKKKQPTVFIKLKKQKNDKLAQ